MWLASVSIRDARGRLTLTKDWSRADLIRAQMALGKLLFRVGDPGRERLFRMNISLCLHRATTSTERQLLPEQFWAAPGGLAGGPVEILRVTGLEPRPAAMPCETPAQQPLDPAQPDFWIPVDCGTCPPCRARARIEAEALSR